MKFQRVTWLRIVRSHFPKLEIDKENEFIGSGKPVSFEQPNRWYEAVTLDQFIGELIAHGYSGSKPAWNKLKEVIGLKRKFTSKFRNTETVWFLNNGGVSHGRIAQTIVKISTDESISIIYKIQRYYDNKEIEMLEPTLFASREELGEAVKKMV